MAGLLDSVDSGVGFRTLLFAKQCVHDAAVSGAAVQPGMRRVPCGNFDHCLHLYENFRAAVCGERGAGTCGGMVALEDGSCAGRSHRNLYDCRRASRVIYTDTVQTLILIAGAVALTVIGLGRVGGFAHLQTMVPPDYFHMMKPATDSAFPWTGIFFGAPILGIWYWCTDQVIVQRVLSARDEGHAKAGTIFAGFLKILPVFMLVLPGIVAYALFAEQLAGKPDAAYPTLVLNLLPTGLVGLVMAALLAAVMGAMSSVFNSASTLVTLDFYKKLRPEASEAQLVNFGRVATGVMVLLGLLWVPFIHLISSQLYIYLQSVQAYISPPIAACFVLGILWPRLNGEGAISSLLTGFVLGAVRFIAELMAAKGTQFSGLMEWLVKMNFLHYAIFMFLVCSLVLVGVSLATPVPDRRKLAGLTFATVDDKIDTIPVGTPVRKPAHETPLEHRVNVVFSLLLLATVVGLWIYFR